MWAASFGGEEAAPVGAHEKPSGESCSMSAETPPDSVPKSPSARPASALVARALGAFLCLAAGLNFFDHFDSYGEGIGWTLSLIGPTVELLIGAALVLRLWPSIAAPAGGLLFLLLAAVNLMGMGRGAAECRCFGPIPMPPWVPFLIDAAGGVALLWGPRTSERYRGRPFVPLDAACIGAFTLGIAFGSVVYPPYAPVTRNISVELIESSRSFTINPNRFQGRPFFLAPFIRIDADFKRGRWKVVLTRPRCRKCDRMLRNGGCEPEGDEQVAVVLARSKEDRDTAWNLPEGCRAVFGELTPDKSWDFEPPLTFRLKDGKVIDVR